MKKYICILATAALFTACEQKSETVTPAAPDHNTTTIVNPSPAETKKTEMNTTIVNPTPAESKKTETNTTTNINTTATATPNP
ncbi:MAG: hypothetical protein ABI992_01175 [Chthoniobacterales bacterium]